MNDTGFSVLFKSRSMPVVLFDAINDLIRDELHAVSTYLWQSSVVDGWGHKRLGEKLFDESQEEVGHAKRLMDRIGVFGKMPNVVKLKDVENKKTVKEMLEHNISLEEGAIDKYNKVHKLACEHDDNGTRKILSSILDDEEGHFDWLKEQMDRINTLGESLYLSQFGEDEDDDEDE